MPYKVKIVSGSDSMKDFLEIPARIYRNDPCWVPPLKSETERILDRENNPYFFNASLCKFVCYHNGDPVARSIAVINREHWRKSGRKAAFFGFFESVKDTEAVSCLFESVSGYCRNEGATLLEGPFNPNHYSEMGILTNNFHTPPVIFETYNPAYYPDLLENNSFRVSKRLHTRINPDAGTYLRNRYSDTSFPNGTSDFKVRHISLWNLKSDLERIREVNNDAFADNWQFLPLTRHEYEYAAKYFFFVTTPRLIVLIEKDREPVGVIQFLLNINPVLQGMQGKTSYADYLQFIWKRRTISSVVLYTAGIKKAYQNTRVAWLMLKAACSVAQHYPVMSTTWISDDNIPSIRTSEHLGLRPYKSFSIYERHIK